MCVVECFCFWVCCFFFFQAEDGIRDLVRSRGLGDVYKRQIWSSYWSQEPSQFANSSDTPCVKVPIAPGGSCTFTVAFDPTVVGEMAETLYLLDNAPGGSQTVTMTGTGTAMPAVSITPDVWSAPTKVSSSGLLSVSCPTTAFCAGVDSSGYAWRYDGASWSLWASLSFGTFLTSVSCRTSSFCVAVGAGGNAFTYNGVSWSAFSTFSFAQLNAVSCPTTSFCVAVDSNDYAFTYNGISWSSGSQLPTTHRLNSVSCATASFCVVVDGVGNAFESAGSTWT